MSMLKRIVSGLVVAALMQGGMLAHAQGNDDRLPNIIRDAEIETTIRAYATPIFKAAGLDVSSVHVYLLQSDQINAFVAGGMNIFIYTGLLVRTERPAQLIGVIAHETGHIAGGHLARARQAMENASLESIIGLVLGGLAGAAAGSAGAAVGGAVGGSQLGQASILQYTRTMEASADAAGMSFLDRTHQSSRGLLEFLTILRHQEFVLIGQPNPYLINHPLTTDRIDNVRLHVEQSPYSDVPDPPAWVEAHKRMVAKLVGYLYPLPQVLQKYPESDNSLYSRYARSIAYFRVGQLQRSLALIDSLIAEHPTDPYFQEQKGQILFDSGRGTEALVNYGKAVELAPDESLIRMELANVQIEQNDPALLKPAIAELRRVVLDDPHYPDNWRLLGIAYGRDNQDGMASWALAESAAAAGNDRQAKDLARRAMDQLPMGTPEWLQSQDIVETVKPKQDNGGGGISG
jgi:predicted Zn-dependent protease